MAHETKAFSLIAWGTQFPRTLGFMRKRIASLFGKCPQTLSKKHNVDLMLLNRLVLASALTMVIPPVNLPEFVLLVNGFSESCAVRRARR